eukprot:gb/GEZN01003623.1/.p1 GENE.gb/GEZN01003623.1/~~gb/GEZN01003623.1/.p1  ORF type:complete len:692 (+),score=99.94 gb/GEZN01003623.1/:187-2076(+)
MSKYEELYKQSLQEPDKFWAAQSKELSWLKPWTKLTSGSFEKGDVKWFSDGQLNVTINCIDRHMATQGDKVAILFEGDEPSAIRRITYKELSVQVNKTANALKKLGIKKGDTVCIYMPMVPEAAFAMLACARIGAPHSVVFAGFSSESLRERIEDASCVAVLTANEGMRAGKRIPLKNTVDAALLECKTVKKVMVFKRTDGEVTMQKDRDVWWSETVDPCSEQCMPEVMESEDVLFMLYTSGSTGKPKGIKHSTAGYLLWASLTHRYVFDIQPNDTYACVADIGWITGHTYIVYGPLANGCTTFMFESSPLHPNPSRFWDMVQRHKFTQFYTAPTAIRSLEKFGTDPVTKCDLSSLRVLGTVGEPINPEAWRWYYDNVGRKNCCIVDTYWQTETGGIMMTPLPGCTPMKPGAACKPFLGVETKLLDPMTGKELNSNNTEGVLCVARPWPGMARTIHGDHERYLTEYMCPYPGYYFSGDGATRDADGYYWITGRVDDVVNVSGHRLGSAEVESALVNHRDLAEAAVIGIPHPIKGQSLFAYCIPKQGVKSSDHLIDELKMEVRKMIGGFAIPDDIVITPALPKTRSGKIMRRVLRKIATNELNSIGDTSTLEDHGVVEALVAAVKQLKGR